MDAIDSHRKIDAGFLEALEALATSAEPNRWKDVLTDRDLFIAVRRNSLNIYYRGASIFRVDWDGSRITPYTHVKYLVRQAQAYVPLVSGHFQYPAPARHGTVMRVRKHFTR